MNEKEQKYQDLFLRISSVLDGETDIIAKMANMAAEIHREFNFWWTGFYRVNFSENELILGPFQGPLACMHISYGRGVCGSSWKQGSTIVVPDVEQFPGHIACSSESRSEIVVPVRDADGRIFAVLDIDSEFLGTFDATDAHWLEKLVTLL